MPSQTIVFIAKISLYISTVYYRNIYMQYRISYKLISKDACMVQHGGYAHNSAAKVQRRHDNVPVGPLQEDDSVYEAEVISFSSQVTGPCCCDHTLIDSSQQRNKKSNQTTSLLASGAFSKVSLRLCNVWRECVFLMSWL